MKTLKGKSPFDSDQEVILKDCSQTGFFACQIPLAILSTYSSNGQISPDFS